MSYTVRLFSKDYGNEFTLVTEGSPSPGKLKALLGNDETGTFVDIEGNFIVVDGRTLGAIAVESNEDTKEN